MTRRKFVVLTSSRTGSTWLIDLLNQVAGIHAHGELFLRQTRSRPAIAVRSDFARFIDAPGASALPRSIRVFSYLNRFYRSQETIGFKLMYSHLQAQPEILLYLATHRTAVIHLVRRNYLDVVVAEELARNTGTSHTTSLESIPLPQVRLDPTTLPRRIRGLEKNDDWIRLLIRLSTCDHIEVAYEDLLNEDRQQLQRILSFLEIRSMPDKVASTLVKRGARSHEFAIINYAEIKELLADTRYRHFLR